MNNEQFRRLIHSNSSKTSNPESSSTLSDPQDGRSGNKTPALGSRMRSSIPMTPRSVSSTTASKDFARQLAEYRKRNGGGDGQPPAKKFKSSLAPKGTKLPSGYVDRSAERRAVGDEVQHGSEAAGSDDVEKKKRLQALEEMLKLGQMDRATFSHLRKELGFQGEYDDGSQRKKGLDFTLLERTRRGEVGTDQPFSDEESTKGEEKPEEDFEAALDAKAREDVNPVEKVAHEKKGNMAPPPPLTSEAAQKMSRNEILNRLRASRNAAATNTAQDGDPIQPAEPTLGTKFKKIGGSEKKRWVETDERTGRRKEVLMTTDKNGNPKRKVRWLDKEPVIQAAETKNSWDGKKQPAAPKPTILGMDVPAEILARQEAQRAENDEAEDDDIFSGVGTNYDPLADEVDKDSDGSDSSSESGEEEEGETKDYKDKSRKKATSPIPDPSSKSSASSSSAPLHRPLRNYFDTSSSSSSRPTDQTTAVTSQSPLSSDPTILASLKRAAALRQAQEASTASLTPPPPSSSSSSSKRRQPNQPHPNNDIDTTTEDETEKRNALLLSKLRARDAADAADLDMGGFSESRFGDDDDEDNGDPRGLTEWHDGADDASDGEGGGGKRGGGGGGNKRKRGAKKRKGDKNSVGDVMRVLEGRKGGKS